MSALHTVPCAVVSPITRRVIHVSVIRDSTQHRQHRIPASHYIRPALVPRKQLKLPITSFSYLISKMSSWTPLESNPEVMSKVLWNFGVSEKWNVVDVLSLDSEMLGLIPRPAVALILLFPTSEKYEKLKEEEEAKLKESGQKISKDVYFLKQYIHNACGTIALIHSIANNLDTISLKDGMLKTFLDSTKDSSPEDRGAELQKNADVAETHNNIAMEGQTGVPGDEEKIIHHFVAFVHKDGDLYELDGRKAFPINHGPTTPEKLVEDAAKVMTDIMKKDPDEVRFTACALTMVSD
ncbi:ubiquitin carboxyl-terminal hydrolase [Nesidiocoris tenuis]|uniref:Ubiquitin carboxyl-terminal hydrolase n=1 Tax=Nesidiocoris tenuis TaxID=355587 RepID=A0ABN7BEQ6_9HEMI|nr:ubiquitin carboxyl-terminal hydrolase [Nesidiocoris tenuis]